MSELANGQLTETPIRDAACLVVVDTSGPEPTLLMGRRHASQIFLPDKWVFPGGRVEEDDRALADRFAGAFMPANLADGIKPFALAAVRELCEETGLVIGTKSLFSHQSAAWEAFAASGHSPSPAELLPFARAITPPGTRPPLRHLVFRGEGERSIRKFRPARRRAAGSRLVYHFEGLGSRSAADHQTCTRRRRSASFGRSEIERHTRIPAVLLFGRICLSSRSNIL